ncbi:MAG: hypothetical protein HY960_15020 [Ignavibacteriae bacterium]|nr:hypothetical protein [Ignavibacteriota bacterium]
MNKFSISKLTKLLLVMAVATQFLFGQQQKVPTEINVEIDWMDDGVHSHRPSQSEIDAVIQMFACQGITLNVDISNNVGHTNTLRRDPGNANNFFGYDGTNGFKNFKDANANHGNGWHYCLFGHDYEDETYTATSSSGLAERPGNDLVVTLGSWGGNIGSGFERAATFAHELGHNLGLKHSGSMNESNVGSYLLTLGSVMSYRYQVMGVKNILECLGLARMETHPYKNIDYSHGRICSIDEDNLDEDFGMGFVSVDWNCSGVIGATGVQRDLSNNTDNDYGWCNQTGADKRMIDDYNEWNNISDVAMMKEGAYQSSTISCITYEESKMVASSFSCTQPTVVSESCNGKGIFYTDYDTMRTIYTGDCSLPFPTITSAQTYTSSGDYIFLYPGNYPEKTLILNKMRTYSGPGTIIVGK